MEETRYELEMDGLEAFNDACEAKRAEDMAYELEMDGLVVGRGLIGFRGNGIESVSSQPSTDDAGENVVTVRTDDGQEFVFVVRNGSRGNGIEGISFKGYDEDGSAIYTITYTDGDAYDFTAPKGLTGNGIERIDVVESTEDAGSNLIDVVFTDGTSKSFSIRNGSKGTAAGFGEVSASIDGNVGTPSVSVETGGTDEEKTFSFRFSNIRGNGISSMKVTPSTEDAGRNAIEFSFLDGSKKSFDIYNGSRGNGISSIDVLPSSADGGENKVTVNFTDGWSKTFSVYNGGTGKAAGFGKPTVSIEGGYGTPTATVEASGSDTAKVFSFKLSNLRGNGIESADYIQSTQDDGSNRLTFTFSDGTTKELAIKNGSKGSKGDTGAPFSISKVYGSIAAMNAGHATDGVPIGGFVVIDTGDVEDPDNAKLFVKNSTEYGYLTDMSGSKGIQGPKGVGVSSVEQTVTSTDDGGENSIVVKLDNGEEFPFAVRNGRKGSTGSAAGFGAPTATVDGNEGTPSVTVTATGPDTAKVFGFAFRNLKGHTPTQDEMDALVDSNETVVDTKDGLAAHISSKSNPHEVTKAQVGLGNVDNTSDMDKPVSTAMQEALDGKVDKVSGKGLSTNDYTTDEKSKLAGIADGANKTVVDSELSSSSTNPVQNKVVNSALAGKANKATTLAGYNIGDAYTKTAVDNLLSGYLKMPIQDNAGFHNSLYRGKDITSYWTDGSLWDRIQGTNGKKLFEDLYVGDWFSTGTHSINGTSANQCFMIGGFDLRRGVGANNVTKHHIVPVACNATGTDTRALFSSQMYATVPFTGAYQGSIVHPLFLPDGAVSTDLKAIFGSHLLQSSELISTANNGDGYGRYGSASGVSTSWTWVDVYGILMSEVEVYGSIVWSSSGYDGGMSSRGQLPLFRLRPDLISSRSYDFWLRDATSAGAFAFVGSGGGDANGSTATSSLGVRPRFLIG